MNHKPELMPVVCLPSTFHSASRFFSVDRMCHFALDADWEGEKITRWNVALEHFTAGAYGVTRRRVGLKEYLPTEFSLAFLDFLGRCEASGLDCGIEFSPFITAVL